MFYYFVCLILLNTFEVQSSEPPLNENKEESLGGFLEDEVNKTLEIIRKALPEPIQIENLNINSPLEMIKGFVNVSNIQITGLKEFKTTLIKVHPFSLQMEFAMNFSSLNINLGYLMDFLMLSIAPIYGNGHLNVHVNDFVVSGSGKVGFSNGLSVKNIKIFVTLGDSVFDIHGLINNEELSLIINSILNDIGVKFINKYKQLISNIISPIIEEFVNDILHPKQTTTEKKTTEQESTTVSLLNNTTN